MLLHSAVFKCQYDCHADIWEESKTNTV